ncbi:hemerythrin domain-containing protein [Parapusillimonas sp. SGNA-6]|nr:hemerythrin domain-containing protein [Parapusillimonas sp. SGNA-6]
MEIERFKQQHVEILQGIAGLRKLAHAGIMDNASDIARAIKALSNVVKVHLAIEDRILYPTLQKGSDPKLANMGRMYQEDMKGIANAYIAFSRRWSSARELMERSDDFRNEANTVLKSLHARMQRENTEFYPAIEAWEM